jgi:hypothetical protein
MATPHIVGLVSVMKSLKPSISKTEIVSLFKSEAVDVSSSSGKPVAKYAIPEKVIAKINNQIAEVKKEPIIETKKEEEKSEEIEEKSEVVTSEEEILLESILDPSITPTPIPQIVEQEDIPVEDVITTIQSQTIEF